MRDITNEYKIKEAECIQKLAQLDRLKIIELLPKNKIKLLVVLYPLNKVCLLF
jgi:hypothetical protein